jgi:hypothetical protein
VVSYAKKEQESKNRMTTLTKPTVPRWYWIVAALALLRFLLGSVLFAVEVFAPEAAMASMTEPEKEWVRSIPGWIYFVYGLAVATGLAGSIGLLLRKGWATPMFAISLGAVVVQMVYTMLIGGGLQVLGPGGLVVAAVVITIGAALLYFSKVARRRGWLSPG